MLALRLPSAFRRPLRGIGFGRPLARPNVRRSSRSAVAAGVVVFLAAQAWTNLALKREWISIRDPLYVEKFWLLKTHPEFLQPAGGRPETVLFVGSSRSLNGVNAKRLKDSLTSDTGRPVSVFNFSLAGCGPVTNALYLRRLADDGVRPDFVVLEVHPVFLAGHLAEPIEKNWLTPMRLRPHEFDLANGLGFRVQPPSAHGPRAWVCSWYEYRRMILDRWFPFMLTDGRINAGHEPDGYGFCRLDETINARDKAGLMARTWLQYGQYMPGFRPGGAGVAALRDSLAQCRRMGCKVAVVLTAESSEFRGWYPADGRAEMEAAVKALAVEYGAALVDGRTWVPDEQNLDGHHLAGPGADTFTDRLGREFLAPWLRGNPAP